MGCRDGARVGEPVVACRMDDGGVQIWSARHPSRPSPVRGQADRGTDAGTQSAGVPLAACLVSWRSAAWFQRKGLGEYPALRATAGDGRIWPPHSPRDTADGLMNRSLSPGWPRLASPAGLGQPCSARTFAAGIRPRFVESR
jgi:hypothetical protein